jgi:hypothetical protein
MTLNRNIIVIELIREVKKKYELGKVFVYMDIDSKKYGEDELIYRYRKNLWIGRRKNEKSSKANVIKKYKIIAEVNSVETIFDGMICSVWNKNAMCRYLSMLTGLRDYEFKIWINGTEWDDKWSFGRRKLQLLKQCH